MTDELPHHPPHPLRREDAARATYARIRPQLEAALAAAGHTHTVDDVLERITAGLAQIWAGERCFAVTEFQDLPQRRILNTWLAGGQARELQALRPGVEAFARAHGASMSNFAGKIPRAARARVSAWDRISGYEPRWIVHSKELNP